MIILDSEKEPLEEDDGSMELNPISEKESGNEEQDSNSRPSGAKLYNEDNMTIVVDYEEELLEEDDDDNIELHPVFEKESSQYDEQDGSSMANNKDEGDNSINSNELGDILINATYSLL